MASRPHASNAALCIAGDAECASGAPAIPKTRVVGVTRSTRYTCLSSAAVNCPGAAVPAYVQREPKRSGSSRVSRPASPIAIAMSPARPLIASPIVRQSRSRAAVTATLTRPAPVARIARTRSATSAGTPEKSWCDTIACVPPCAAAHTDRQSAFHSTSTYSAPALTARRSTPSRSSSPPSNAPPSQAARQVTTVGRDRPSSAPATSSSPGASASRRSSTRSTSVASSRARRSSAIVRACTV